MVANSHQHTHEASVLIVEDERDLADLYDAWLSESYDTEVAYSGIDAQERLNEEEYDVVLLDRRMPDIAGDEVLETIRDRDLNCKVAMLTAVSPDFDVIGMGFDSYVVKPVTNEEVHEVVERLLKLDKYQRGVQDLYSLVEKQAVLEAEMPPEALAASDEYAALKDEIATKRSESRASMETVDDEGFRVLMEGLNPRDPGSDEV